MASRDRKEQLHPEQQVIQRPPGLEQWRKERKGSRAKLPPSFTDLCTFALSRPH